MGWFWWNDVGNWGSKPTNGGFLPAKQWKQSLIFLWKCERKKVKVGGAVEPSVLTAAGIKAGQMWQTGRCTRQSRRSPEKLARMEPADQQRGKAIPCRKGFSLSVISNCTFLQMKPTLNLTPHKNNLLKIDHTSKHEEWGWGPFKRYHRLFKCYCRWSSQTQCQKSNPPLFWESRLTKDTWFMATELHHVPELESSTRNGGWVIFLLLAYFNNSSRTGVCSVVETLQVI